LIIISPPGVLLSVSGFPKTKKSQTFSAAAFRNRIIKKPQALETAHGFYVISYDLTAYGGHASLRKLRHHQYPARQNFF